MTLAYILKLSFKVRTIDIEAQKINGSTLETFRMVMARFQIEDKLGRT